MKELILVGITIMAFIGYLYYVEDYNLLGNDDPVVEPQPVEAQVPEIVAPSGMMVCGTLNDCSTSGPVCINGTSYADACDACASGAPWYSPKACPMDVPRGSTVCSTTRPSTCSYLRQPVCGSNNRTYVNPCRACQDISVEWFLSGDCEVIY